MKTLIEDRKKVKHQTAERWLALRRVRRDWQLYALLSLPLFYLVLFKYVPMYGASIAFKDFLPSKGILGSEWAGLKHFHRFFDSYDFWRIIRNTFSLSVYQLAAGFPFPILLALSLNQVKDGFFKKSVQMVTYAPHFISVVVVVGILLQFLNPRTGIIANLFGLLGIQPVNIMGKAEYFQSLYVWSGVWQQLGFSCIIYLAALTNIDPALHESAAIDGAHKLHRMWYIDLPGIMPIALILLILNVGSMLDLGFEKVLLLQNPINLRTSEILDTYVYKVGLISTSMNYSYSAAIGLFRNLVSLFLLVAVNRIVRKFSSSSLW